MLAKSRICCPGEENLPQSESADAIECCVALKDLGPNEHLITNLLLNVANFSNLNRAQRILVYVLRLLQIKVLSKISTNNKFVQFIKDHISKTGKIRTDELKAAELVLVINALHPDEDTKSNMGIYEDEFGILRCRRRLHKCESLLDECKYPVYLSYHAPLTGLILNEFML